MVITIATLGYGDVVPTTSIARVSMGLFVLISLMVISLQTQEVNELMKINTLYKANYKASSGEKHVILSGYFNKMSFVQFLNEFFHDDHSEESLKYKIVIIQPNFPDQDIENVLCHPKYEQNLHYIIGDIFHNSTLEKAMIKEAEAIFFLTDQEHKDKIQNDLFVILASKRISIYC